ncbi:hypothetical protein ACUW9Z_000502 [Aerococcus sp. 150760007-1]|uniref:Uncharacterized protein n=1 Tax=Aerococcus urinaeequi TaxID=51665 RepID=A0ABR5ZX68_9LACT|nr:hypothetical protein [Aerococcus urinaeequi]MBA5746329.1 hypothetical protein [Aerococcus urinaeequi]MBA5829113.1 hypothetical protein [Aerococcus urinaeequi]MBA5860046.1 hypothetical protein [Aerococcus urinaeequi]
MRKKIRQPGKELLQLHTENLCQFQSSSSQLTGEVNTNSIASYYFMTIAPYIFPDAEKYHLMNLSEVIHLFLHGVLK